MAFSIICYYYYYCCYCCCCCLLIVNNVIIINTIYCFFLQEVNSILSLIADELFQSSGVTVTKALVNTSCINITINLLPSPYI